MIRLVYRRAEGTPPAGRMNGGAGQGDGAEGPGSPDVVPERAAWEDSRLFRGSRRLTV